MKGRKAECPALKGKGKGKQAEQNKNFNENNALTHTITTVSLSYSRYYKFLAKAQIKKMKKADPSSNPSLSTVHCFFLFPKHLFVIQSLFVLFFLLACFFLFRKHLFVMQTSKGEILNIFYSKTFVRNSKNPILTSFISLFPKQMFVIRSSNGTRQNTEHSH